jgi:hypothetical protein
MSLPPWSLSPDTYFAELPHEDLNFMGGDFRRASNLNVAGGASRSHSNLFESTTAQRPELGRRHPWCLCPTTYGDLAFLREPKKKKSHSFFRSTSPQRLPAATASATVNVDWPTPDALSHSFGAATSAIPGSHGREWELPREPKFTAPRDEAFLMQSDAIYRVDGSLAAAASAGRLNYVSEGIVHGAETHYRSKTPQRPPPRRVHHRRDHIIHCSTPARIHLVDGDYETPAHYDLVGGAVIKDPKRLTHSFRRSESDSSLTAAHAAARPLMQPYGGEFFGPQPKAAMTSMRTYMKPGRASLLALEEIQQRRHQLSGRHRVV